MPTVKTQSTRFGGKPFRMRVTVLKDGVFRIRLPEWSHEALGQEVIEEKTLDKAEREFEAVRGRFGEMLRATRKVIRYRFFIQDKTQRYCGPEDERSDIGFGIGKGVQLGVGNYTETAHADADGKILRYSYEDDDGKQPYPQGYQYGDFDCLTADRVEAQTIDWTAEREAWFVALCGGLDSLIAKLKSLDEDKTRFLEAVSNGRALHALAGGADRVGRGRHPLLTPVANMR